MTERVIERRPRPRQRVYIKLSGGRFFTIPAGETNVPEVGAVLTEADVERLSRMDHYFRGKEKALRLLSVRSRTRYEIFSALNAIGLKPSIRNGILGELEEHGLLDDARFAREYISAKVDRKQLGPHRLKFQLAKLGVAVSIINAALGEIFTEKSQEQLAWNVVQKKLSQQKPDEKTVRRLGALLRRKGFDYDVVNRVSYALLKRIGRETDME